MHGVYILFFDNHKMIPIQALRGNTVEKNSENMCHEFESEIKQHATNTYVSMSTEGLLSVLINNQTWRIGF